MNIEGLPDLSNTGILTGPFLFKDPRDEFVLSQLHPSLNQVIESWAPDCPWRHENPARHIREGEYIAFVQENVRSRALPWEQNHFAVQEKILLVIFLVARYYLWTMATQRQVHDLTLFKRSTIRKNASILARKGLLKILNGRDHGGTSYQLLLEAEPQKPKRNPDPSKAREALAEKRRNTPRENRPRARKERESPLVRAMGQELRRAAYPLFDTWDRYK